MAIKGVVFDVSGTLLNTTGQWPKTFSTTPPPGVAEMLRDLKGLGLTIVAASNDPLGRSLQASGLDQWIDHALDRRDVGKAKPSNLWIDKFREVTGFAPNELLYVGDSDHDIYTAAWGPMLYAHAEWSSPAGQYGLRAPTPRWVVNVADHILRKQHPWYWTLDTADQTGRPVHAMTLIDADGAGDDRARQRLLQLLKDDVDTPLRRGPVTLRDFVMLHLLASIYDENLFGGADLWTTYPGHAGAENKIMGDFLDVAAKLSRNKYRGDLFVRHTVAMNSRDARKQHGNVFALQNQLETVRINEAYRRQVTGKRVLLLDNFLTYGYSTEAGRLLLLNAGAAEVVVACVAKYGPRINVISPPNVAWDSFAVARPASTTFRQIAHTGDHHPDALQEFRNSLVGLANAIW